LLLAPGTAHVTRPKYSDGLLGVDVKKGNTELRYSGVFSARSKKQTAQEVEARRPSPSRGSK